MILLALLLTTVVALASRRDESVTLVRRALAREPEAVRALVRRVVPIIRARVHRLVGAGVGSHAGDDLVQEVWLALLKDDGRQLRSYDPSRGLSLENYVGMVAERIVGNTRQKLRATKRGVDKVQPLDAAKHGEVAGATPDPERQLASRDLVDALHGHLKESLSEKGWIIFRCLYTDGRSVDETAATLGVKRQVVYNWQHKIRGLARAFRDAQ